jgi:spore coat polysaccharide biosynthesis protein SpsF
MRPIQGQPLLGWIVARCRQAAALGEQVVVATSDRPVDTPIVEYCAERHIPYFRGSADNVAERVLRCAQAHGWAYFFRVNGDSPFVEPTLLQAASQQAATDHYDFITNLAPRTFPYGVSLELVGTRTFAAAYAAMHTSAHFEHVTLYLYEHLSDYRVYAYACPAGDLSSMHLTVDTEADWARFEQLVAGAGAGWPTLSLSDLIPLYQALEIARD